MKNVEDLIATAEWQIENFDRPSAKVSKEMLKELKNAKEEIEVYKESAFDWYGAYLISTSRNE